MQINKKTLKDLLDAFQRAKNASNAEEHFEAISDLDKISKYSVPFAILAEMLKIQIEKPILIPMTLFAILTSLVLFVRRF